MCPSSPFPRCAGVDTATDGGSKPPLILPAIREERHIGKHPRVSLRREHLRALLAGTIVAASLAGCGSGAQSDRDQIAAIIKQEGSSPQTLCSHLTDALLATLGGKSGCLRQAASAAADPSTHVTAVRVHGKSATATVVDREGARSVSLLKQRGTWKIAGVS